MSFFQVIFHLTPCYNSIFIFLVKTINFLRPLEDMVLPDVGLEAVFECEVSEEGLKAEWLKDGKSIKSSENVLIKADGGIHRLVINTAKAEDIGQYSIKFKNAGSDAKLIIRGMK